MTHDTESERGLPELPTADIWVREDFGLGDIKQHIGYSEETMRAYAIAAIEKDRAERSEAVPVGDDDDLARIAYKGYNDYWKENCLGDETEAWAASAKAVLYTAPPERSDVQGAERLALENVRLLAARHRKEEWAQHMLRFCAEAGVEASPLRASRPAVQQEGFEPFLCISPACGDQCSDCNMAISPQHQRDYAIRYAYLRQRPVESIALADGGVFAGRVPQNEVLNGEDLDAAIDALIAAAPPAAACAKDDE